MSALPQPATVFLVDDDPPVRRSVERLVRAERWNVVTFNSPQEFLEKQDPDTPGCLVLDVAMPGCDGLELQQTLARMGNRLPIVFLTGHGDLRMSVRAMKAGATDFLSKPCPDEELLAAIRLALDQDRQFRRAHAIEQAVDELLASLTPRERQVMLGMVAGRLNKQIAVELGTAEKTIKIHRARVMEKLRVSSVADLVRLTERAYIAYIKTAASKFKAGLSLRHAQRV